MIHFDNYNNCERIFFLLQKEGFDNLVGQKCIGENRNIWIEDSHTITTYYLYIDIGYEF